MKFISLLFCLLVVLLSDAFSQYKTGALVNKKLYHEAPVISPILKFNDPINQTSFSLKQFCPKPQNQGNIGSCTGWAAGYAGLTIAEAILDENYNTEEITKNARSALYVYNQLKTCDKGSYMPNVFNKIKENGDCLIQDFNPNSCMILPNEIAIQKGKELKITDYTRIWDISDSKEIKINNAKRSLLQKRPIIVVLHTKKSLQNIPKHGLYAPKNTDIDGGYHAICLIGFDDTKQQFEFINSWGTNWGNEGFFTMYYDDFTKFADEGYQFKIERFNSNRNFNIYGNFELLKLKGNNNETAEANFKSVSTFLNSDNYYNLNQPIKKDDFFRLRCMNLKKDTYVYLFSYKPDKTTEILFPLKNGNENINDVAFIPENNTSFELPANIENGYTAEISGNDYLVILFSSQPINNLKYKVSDINNYGGDIWKWLNQSYPERIISPHLINYSKNNMGVNSSLKFGAIVPIILKAKII
jgi:hypothetical protein